MIKHLKTYCSVSIVTDDRTLHNFLYRTGPFFLALALNITALAILEPNDFLAFLPFIFLYILPFLGKDTTIPAAVALGYHPLTVALSIAATDIALTLLFFRNWDIVLKIPVLGDIAEGLHDRVAGFIAKRPKFRELSFTGLTLLCLYHFVV